MDDFLTEAYRSKPPEAVRDLYDAWSATYDDEIAAAGYAAPARVAAALRAEGADPSAPVLDFGCGTGLSGAALAAAGFAAIDGVDLSPAMLDRAGARGIYRRLALIAPDEAPAAGGYGAVAACGVFGPGCAPRAVLDALVEGMDRGAILAVTLNDTTLADPAFAAAVPGLVAAGRVRLRRAEHGAHLPGRGIGAMVAVLERL